MAMLIRFSGQMKTFHTASPEVESQEHKKSLQFKTGKKKKEDDGLWRLLWIGGWIAIAILGR